MIPQISNDSISQIQLISYPNKTYKLTNNQIVGKIDNLDAIKQSIEHILSIERYAYPIYDDNYGIELEKYIGKSKTYLEATIEDTLREALTQDDRILDVSVTDIEDIKVKSNLIDKSKFYERISTEDYLGNISNESNNGLIVENQKVLLETSIVEVPAVNVSFDVYCKQGIIQTEVKISV